MGTGGVAAGEISAYSAPLRACFYLSEPTSLPLLLPRRLDLMLMIPKGMVFTVTWGHIEDSHRKGCLSTSHRGLRCLSVTETHGPWSGGSCRMVPTVSWCHRGSIVHLMPEAGLSRTSGCFEVCTKLDFSLITIIPCCTRHPTSASARRSLKGIEDREAVPSPRPLQALLFRWKQRLLKGRIGKLLDV